MCAIAGLIGLTYDSSVLDRMHRTMLRRGPDGNGRYEFDNGCLLHTRLAIIDQEGGSQPMGIQWAGERYTITYNGEIYNLPEIKKELEAQGHQFVTRSDTELVLRSYIQWGEGAVDKLNGIFAFGVLEEKRGRLFLARDRIGVKPLFYGVLGNGFIFASEIKTLLAYPDFPHELDSEGVGEMLLLGPGRTPGCGVFRGVRELEPGCCGFFEKGKLKLRRYWSLKDREHHESFEETVETVRWLVTDAIKRQMVSDVPIGTFLSGGLDSSLITAICARYYERPLDTFSLGYKDNERYFKANKFQPDTDDTYIRYMAEHLATAQHWTILNTDDLVDQLENGTRARDLPGMADVDFSLVAFCKEIRNHVKVALSGECADEIFGGYPWYTDPEIRQQEGFPWAQNTKQRVSILHPEYRSRLDGEVFVRDRYEETRKACDILPGTDPAEKRMKEMVNLNHRWFMQTLLDRKDRMSMFQGLEVRVPFCDYRIAEYMYGVPWAYKYYGGREKGLLRKAMEGVLPDKILYRKKSPYPKTWHPSYLEAIRKRFDSLLEDQQNPVFQMVDHNAIKIMAQQEAPWPWYGQLMRLPQTMAYILQLEFWLREYKVNLI